MTRSYLRVDPQLYERKVVEQGYPLPLFGAFVGVLCLAEHQPSRGRFRNERILRALLDHASRFVPELIKRGDLIARADGTIYVDGWDEWQEGDVTVKERVARIRGRARPKGTVATVTSDTPPTVSAPSSMAGQSGTTPQPPTSGGRRSEGTNPRSVAAELTRQAEQAERDRKARRNSRYLAQQAGRITPAQRIEMDERDAPLEEIPAERGAAYQATA